MRFAKSQEPKGRILNATIRQNASGKFFVSILCEEEIDALPKKDSSIGIDLGITDFAIFSDGRKVDNHRFTSKMEKNLRREQRKLSRSALVAQKNGVNLLEAKNYQKQKRKVAKLHEKVMNQRNDFLHKLSTKIIKNHDIVCMEDLNSGLSAAVDIFKNLKLPQWFRVVMGWGQLVGVVGLIIGLWLPWVVVIAGLWFAVTMLSRISE